MASIVKIKRSSVQGKAPTISDLQSGELALNTRDGKLFSSDGSVVFEVGANVSSISVGSIAIGNASSYTLPTADGTSGQFLKTDGEGNITFASPGGGVTGGSDSLGYTNSTTTADTILAGATYDCGVLSEESTTDAFGVYISGEVFDAMEPIREIITADTGAL